MILCLLVSLQAQVVNSLFGSIKGWKGSCVVTIVDSTAEALTEYSFDGPAILLNEMDMSPYNSSWPNPSVSLEEMNTSDIEEMMKFSKAQEDKWRVWDAMVKVKRRVEYDDGMSNADYTCTCEKTEKLKLQIVIMGSQVIIAPEVTYSGNLTCSGTRDDVAVLPEEDHRLYLDNFNVTSEIPGGGSKRLTGTKTLTDDAKRITVKWDFSPVE